MLSFTATVWFYRQPIDFRKQIDGLIILVADTLKMDPTSGQLFIFRNKKADKLKMLYWEDDGFWMFYIRRETSCHLFPAKLDAAIELRPQQLQWLLSGLDFSQKNAVESFNTATFISGGFRIFSL
jgi:transposase